MFGWKKEIILSFSFLKMYTKIFPLLKLKTFDGNRNLTTGVKGMWIHLLSQNTKKWEMGGRCLHVAFQVWIHLDSYSGWINAYVCFCMLVGIWGFYNRPAGIHTTMNLNWMIWVTVNLNYQEQPNRRFIFKKQKICSFSIALYRKYTNTHDHV